MTNATNATIQTETKRNADISTAVLLRCQVQSFNAGETIDGLILRLEKETGITGINVASLNVRRSQTKAKLVGEWAAQRTDLTKKLAEAIATSGEASDEANEVRALIRGLDKKEATYLKTFKLARKGRTGDRPGMLLDDMLTDIILEEMTDGETDSETVPV